MTTFHSKFVGSSTISAIAGVMMLLSGCGGASVNNPKICTQPGTSYLNPETKRADRGSTEQMVMNEDCIHAWAYRLGKAPGGNREIAEAVIEACSLGILYEANMRVQEQTGEKANKQSEALFAGELEERYIKTALFHVVQGRAGQCKIP
jgi:hypothetical protein